MPRFKRDAYPGLSPQLRDVLHQISRQTGSLGLSFMQDNLAASQTAVALTLAEVNAGAGNVSIGHVMPFPGCIVAVSALVSTAGSAGTLTVGPSIDTNVPAAPSLSITTQASMYRAVPFDSVRFAAGAVIGSTITTDGSWNGTTSDLAVLVLVQLELPG